MSVDWAQLLLLVLGATLLVLCAMVLVLNWRHVSARRALFATVEAFIAEDSAPSMTTDADGAIAYLNAAAREYFDADTGMTLAAVLKDAVAQPASVIYRLQNKALALGAAREEMPVRGGRLSVAVHRVGLDGYLWRIEEMGAGASASHGADGIGLPMMTVSRAGTILYMNDALRRLLGGRETALDRVFTDLPVTGGTTQTIRAGADTARVSVVEVALSGGRRELYLLPEPERPLVEEGEWGVVESLPVPLLRLDPEGRVLMSNARARGLLGVDRIKGTSFAELVEGLGRPVQDWLDDAWANRNLGRVETLRAVRRDTETFLQISLEKLRDEQGDALIVVMTDATEFKSLEKQFIQSQKMQAIGQLAGGVAHDFNNLLTAITGHCDLLLLRHEENDQDYADLTQISQNANRAAALVFQLLAFSRKQTLRPDVIDLIESMSDLTHLLGRLVGEKVQLDFTHDTKLRPVRADKRQLEQVVMNLVVNARDAMAEGGTIKLDVRNAFLDRPLERDRVRVQAGDYVTIKVVDEGCGIPEDKMARIFEPFFSTKGANGTGLGLSMAYGIIKQSGGFIFVDSVVGSGTTFTIYLPVYVPRAGDAPVEANDAKPDVVVPPLPSELPPAARGQAHGVEAEQGHDKTALPRPTHEPTPMSGGNVLIVEDEAPVRAFAVRALKLRGYNVMEAESAEDALELLSDPAITVDVVVTDVIMPGMDGPTWVSKALVDRPGVKVVFVSGYAEESVSEHQKRIPNSVFLPKPFSLSELTATVSAQIH